MKLLIPSYGRADTISTDRIPAFADLEPIVLVHDGDEAVRYLTGGQLCGSRVVTTDAAIGPGGKTRQMQRGLQLLAEPGEWVIFADDDMTRLTAVEPELWPYSRVAIAEKSDPEMQRRFVSDVSADRWTAIVGECIERATSLNAHLVGFATNRNYYFRTRKWRTVGRVAGGLTLWRYDPSYSFDDSLVYQELRDTAEHLRRYGAVLINNFVWAECGMFTPGGQGTADQRRVRREADLPGMMRAYPGLFRPDWKGGYPDLRIRFTSEVQVERWRRMVMAQGTLAL